MKSATDAWERLKAGSGGDPKLLAPSPRRVRIHVPPKDGMPETVRGVGSAVRCSDCGAELRGRTHAEVRKAWRFHKLEGCT